MEIRGHIDNFKIATKTNTRNTSKSPAFGGARRCVPPLLVLRCVRGFAILLFCIFLRMSMDFRGYLGAGGGCAVGVQGGRTLGAVARFVRV
jgi:hypothetical protein